MKKPKTYKAFVTGSRAYGSPHWKSDIDLVVLVSEEDLNKLSAVCDDDFADEQIQAGYAHKRSVSLRFGGLNLLCCLRKKDYDVWKDGTLRLKNRGKPVDREDACELFRELRRKAAEAEGDES